ncbi:hypothetical protein ACFL0M_12960 [Thermodesulfobacteriota bacterium]
MVFGDLILDDPLGVVPQSDAAGWPFYRLGGIRLSSNIADAWRCVRLEEQNCDNACIYAFGCVSSAIFLLMADIKIV